MKQTETIWSGLNSTSQNLSSFIDSLSDYSQLESDSKKFEKEITQFNIKKAVGEVLSQLQPLIKIKKVKQTIEYQGVDD